MKNEIRFTLESKQRPKLAREIGNILGTAPHYERVPSCAYDIAGYRLDKEGVLHIPDGVEEETVEDLILKLRALRRTVFLLKQLWSTCPCLCGGQFLP